MKRRSTAGLDGITFTDEQANFAVFALEHFGPKGGPAPGQENLKYFTIGALRAAAMKARNSGKINAEGIALADGVLALLEAPV